MPFCDFVGSYYNPEPWVTQECPIQVAVPEGCPFYFVASGPVDLSNITTLLASGNADPVLTANTATVVGSDDVTFSVMNVWSCDCEPTNIAVSFQHIELAVPAAKAGDHVTIWGTGADHDVVIDPPGPCPTPEWPSSYSAALACDRCPPQDNGEDQDPSPEPLDIVGCSATRDASPIMLGVLALAMLLRRRSR